MAFDPISLTIELIILAISYALRPKIPAQKDNPQGFKATTLDETKKLRWLFGTKIIEDPDLWWYGDVGTKKIRLHKSPPSYVDEYHLSQMLVFCRGPADVLSDILVEKKSAWTGSVTSNQTITINRPDLFGPTNWQQPGEGGIRAAIDVQFGAANQAINSYMDSSISLDIPAYRGVFCLVVRGVPSDAATGYKGAYLGYSGYLKNFSAKVTRIKSGWDGGTCWYSAKAQIGDQMNPAHIIYQLLTDKADGAGKDPSVFINNSSFTTAADTFYSEGLGLLLDFDESQSIDDVIRSVEAHCGAVLVENRTDGKFELIVLRYSASTSGLNSLDESNSELQKFNPIGFGQSINKLTVNFTDASNNYETGSITVSDLPTILSEGGIKTDQVNYPLCTDATLAYRLGERDLRALTAKLFTADLIINRSGWNLREGDRMLFSSAKHQLINEIVRITKINRGNLVDRSITVNIIKDVFSLPIPIYNNDQSSGFVDIDEAPAKITNGEIREANYYDLVSYADGLVISELSSNQSFIIGVAEKPAPQNKQFRFYTSLSDVTVDYTPDQFYGGYTPVTTLYSSISALQTDIQQAGISFYAPSADIDVSFDINLWAYIGNESVFVESGINRNFSGNHRTVLTVRRGCFDTVPVSHTTSDKIWFFNGNNGVLDEALDHLKGVTEYYRLVPAGYSIDGVVSTADTIEFSPSGRWARPWPPADVKFDGSYFPATAGRYFTLTCSGRNKITQDEILGWTDNHIAEEEGVTYTLIIKDRTTSDLILRLDGLTSGPDGFTYVFDVNNTAYGYSIEFFTVKAGLECYQKVIHAFNISGGGTISYPQVPSAVWFNSHWRSVTTGSGSVLDLSGGGQRLTWDGSTAATSWTVDNSDLSAKVYNGVTYFADSTMIGQSATSPLILYRTTGDWIELDVSDYAEAFESGGLLNALIYDGSQWVFVRNYGNDIAVSSDLSAITNVAGDGIQNDLAGILSCSGLLLVGSTYVAVGTHLDAVSGITYTKVATSADLISWSDEGNVVPAVQGLFKAVYFSSSYFVYGVEPSPGGGIVAVYKSSDCVTWTKVALAIQDGTSSCLMLVIGSTLNIGVGDDVFKSTDGSTFTKAVFRYVFDGSEIDPVIRAKLLSSDAGSAPSVAILRAGNILSDGGRLMSLSSLDGGRTLVYPSSHSYGTYIGVVRMDAMGYAGKISESGFRVRNSKYLNGQHVPRIALGRKDSGGIAKRYFEVKVVDIFDTLSGAFEVGLCDRFGNQVITVRSDGKVFAFGAEISTLSLDVAKDSVFGFECFLNERTIKIYKDALSVTPVGPGQTYRIYNKLEYTFNYPNYGKMLFPMLGCAGAELIVNAGQLNAVYLFNNVGYSGGAHGSGTNYGWVIGL